jgi:heterodisulfide reductase subunit A-like polyferredoxin
MIYELNEMTSEKPAFIMCVCTGKCPGFEKMDIWDFINTVRMVLPVKHGIIHPQLCEADGDRYLEDVLQPGQQVFIGGCAPIMQYKLFRDAFKNRGMDVQKDLVPIDVRDMTTEEAIEKVTEELKKHGYEVE